MKFILNSSIHTLPTMNNLKLWNKTFSDKCSLCGNRDSTHQCLSNCKVSLNQKWYMEAWQPNKVYCGQCGRSDIQCTQWYSRFPDFKWRVPACRYDCYNTKSDVVILDHKEKTIHLFELTVKWESNYEKNNTFKSHKYAHFLMDITKYKPSLTAFEVGVRGHLDRENMKTFTDNLSALAVNSSYFIYTCRKEGMWNQTSYLGPPF